MPTVAELKAASEKTLQEINSHVSANRESQNGYEDEREWRLDADRAGNGAARIRFLPNAEGDTTNLSVVPAARIYNHSFRGKGGWYIENSLLTVKKRDPVEDLLKWLRDTKQFDQKEHRKYFRQKRYVSNIIVLDDRIHAECNGRHYFWKYPKTIYELVEEKFAPTPEQFGQTPEPVNVTDFWTGCDFIAQRMKKEGFTNYKEKSKFLDQGPLILSPTDEETNDKAIMELYGRLYPMSEFIDPDSKHYKPYDRLLERLQKALDMDLGFLNQDQKPATMSVPSATELPSAEISPAPKTATEIAADDDKKEHSAFQSAVANSQNSFVTATEEEGVKVDMPDDSIPDFVPPQEGEAKPEEAGDPDALSYFRELAKK